MQTHFTASELARQFGCRPRDISDAFYARELDDKMTVIDGRTRLIPLGYIETVRAVLVRRGRVRPDTVSA